MKLELASGDLGAGMLLDACTRVKSILPYLRSEVGDRGSYVPGPLATKDSGWIRCSELVSEQSSLESVIRATGMQLGTDDQVVAASLFVQNYSYRVLSLAIACATTSGVVPDSVAASMAITLSAGRPSAVAYINPAVLVVTQQSISPSVAFQDSTVIATVCDFVISRGFEEHLRLLVESTRERIRIGERLLWGNVAASAAVAFRTMEGCLGSWVREFGEQFFETCPKELQGLGSFFALEHAGRQGWYWERTSCCLHDRLPSKIRCGDCSRTPVDERRAAYRASLETR